MSGQIVTALIKKLGPHPDAKKLKLCTVFDGSEDLQIVCGAANAREGMVTILAQTGSTLPGGMKIEKAVLRGVDSFGMLCSPRELGMTDSGGVVDLPPETKAGQPFQTLPIDIFSSTPWYLYEEKEAFWQHEITKDIVITKNGETPKEIGDYNPLSKTYLKDGELVTRSF